MELKPFQTESRRILDLMVHSIYTHKEIFLRELISNASDAMDKLYYRSLTEPEVQVDRGAFRIRLEVDQDKRCLVIEDNGIGMSREDLENNLGVIAQSGTLLFKKDMDPKEDVDIIGQFGVGFYSAFMVSKAITVISRAYGSQEAYRWHSAGVEGFTIEPWEKEGHGTEIILEIKDNEGEDSYDAYVDPYQIRQIVKRYSDYIRYPIQMEMEKSIPLEPKEEGEEPAYETVLELETLNSMIPLWRRQKSELSEEDYAQFYMEKFYDFEKPLRHLHIKAEGTLSYNALLYIPARAPYDFYSKEFEKGLQLYANGVLIMDKCGDLLPDHFSFVRGLVDTQDLSLNISREMLQQDRQLKAIAKGLGNKIKAELVKMQQEERSEYETFFKAFGLQLKFALYNSFGMEKGQLQELLMYHSVQEDRLITLAEYKAKMPEGQKAIYYGVGESVARIKNMPQAEAVLEKGYDLLALTESIDEFAIKVLNDYEKTPFQSISAGDLGLEEEGDKKDLEEKAQAHQNLFQQMEAALGDKVKKVRLSQRLKSHPVCLTSEGPLSLEMEKVLKSMPTDEKVKAERILEINPRHRVFETLARLEKDDPEKLKVYSDLLYNQALLIEGLPVEDPVAFANAVCSLME